MQHHRPPNGGQPDPAHGRSAPPHPRYRLGPNGWKSRVSGSDEQTPPPGEREPGQDEAGVSDASRTPASPSGGGVAPEDDLAGFQTSMARFFSRTRVWLG